MVKHGANKSNKTNKTIIKIGDKWVNVTTWMKSHPGGSAALERYHGQDATDAFYALHSEEAVAQVVRMKSVSVDEEIERDCVASGELEANFRVWREELKQDGWFERQWAMDALLIGAVLALCLTGWWLADTWPILATVLLGVGMQQGGWVGHDYSHGRGKACLWLARIVSPLVNGFSRSWWSDKHNTHHVHPNQHGVDSDIQNDPILHLHVPSTSDDDVWYRRYQHIYYHGAYMFLFLSWRMQSVTSAWQRRDWFELATISVNYMLLTTLPLAVTIGALLLGGWLVAEVVTSSHQSEDFKDDIDHQFVRNQFESTRDVVMQSRFANYMWGGMQYQLIHHLFPTMPRYRYPAMVPLMHKFAKQNNIEYRTASAAKIWEMNYNTMKKFAQAKPKAA